MPPSTSRTYTTVSTSTSAVPAATVMFIASSPRSTGRVVRIRAPARMREVSGCGRTQAGAGSGVVVTSSAETAKPPTVPRNNQW
ncbi:Uncharacterised protein [Mycobacteroides abscessus subsp. abscessus]|nr:Uncharacterised protein [Mycobacteroides abscessus subsp. abscessus]